MATGVDKRLALSARANECQRKFVRVADVRQRTDGLTDILPNTSHRYTQWRTKFC